MFTFAFKINKQSLALIGVGLAVFSAPAFSQEAKNPKPVDFVKANPVLKAIANEMSSQDEHIKNANPSFDTEYSDLEKNRLRYSLEAEFINTPWQKENDVGNLKGITSYNLIETDAKDANGKQRPDVIVVDSDITVKTDVLALARHAANVALKGNHYHNKNESIATKTKELLERLARVDSLASLKELLQEGQAHADNVVTEEILEAPRKRQNRWNITKSDWITQEKAYKNIRITSEPSEKDEPKMIIIKSPSIGDLASHNAQFRDQVHTENTSVEFARNSFKFVTKIRLTLDYATAGDNLKGDLRKALNELTSKEHDEAAVRRAYREALKSFKSVAVDNEFAD